MQVQEQRVIHMKAPVLSSMKAPNYLPVKRYEVSPPGAVPDRVKVEGQFVKPNKWQRKVMFVRLRLVYKRRKCGLSAHVLGQESSTHLTYIF